jgi:hypothetical protein
LLYRVLSPPAEIGRLDTGLRFTDILFGFVIRELFLRFQHWGSLPWFVRWQLVAGTVLVLGSWIGFRRSLNRSTYEVKFFNLPFFRFLLDQGMVLLYFRVATLTPNEGHPDIAADALGQATIGTLFAIFGLYLLWDIGALWMASVREGGRPKYGKVNVDTNAQTGESAEHDWMGFGITGTFFLAFGLLMLVTYHRHLEPHGAEVRFCLAIAGLILFRWAKEIRTTFRPTGTVTAAAGTTELPSA